MSYNESVIDISHHNEVESFSALYDGGVRGIIHKATQGTGFVDSKYGSRRKAARLSGFMFGAYHFGTGDASGTEQAKHFIDTVQPDERTLLSLDFEPNTTGGSTMTVAQAVEFIKYVVSRTGRYPLFYAGHLIKEAKPSSEQMLILEKCPLWVCQYGATVIWPTSIWDKWTLWQYTESGRAAGIKGNLVDRNRFVGDNNALRKLWGYPFAPEVK